MFPRSPEEVAMCLSRLTKKEQCIVKGIIIGFLEKGGGGMTAQEQLARERA